MDWADEVLNPCVAFTSYENSHPVAWLFLAAAIAFFGVGSKCCLYAVRSFIERKDLRAAVFLGLGGAGLLLAVLTFFEGFLGAGAS